MTEETQKGKNPRKSRKGSIGLILVITLVLAAFVAAGAIGYNLTLEKPKPKEPFTLTQPEGWKLKRESPEKVEISKGKDKTIRVYVQESTEPIEKVIEETKTESEFWFGKTEWTQPKPATIYGRSWHWFTGQNLLKETLLAYVRKTENHKIKVVFVGKPEQTDIDAFKTIPRTLEIAKNP